MSTGPLQIAIKAEHLTDALRRSGALGDGRVCNVVVESSRSTLLSNIIRLRLTYDGEASHAPNSVILKTALPERIGGLWNAGRQEVAFYTQVAAVMSARLVPRCFEAVWDADTKAWHLLLEDLTDSHVIATTWPLPPTMEQMTSNKTLIALCLLCPTGAQAQLPVCELIATGAQLCRRLAKWQQSTWRICPTCLRITRLES